MEKYLTESKNSGLRCSGATGDSLGISKVGNLKMFVEDKRGGGVKTQIDVETHTATNLSKPLFSIAKMYEGGDWDFLLRADNRGGPCLIKYNPTNTPTSEIPIRWDYGDHCPYIDHELRRAPDGEGNETPANPRKRHERLVNTVNKLPTLKIIIEELKSSKIVEDLVCVNCVNAIDEMNTTGAKRGMRPAMKKLTQKAFHKSHGHIGTCEGGCDICIRKRGNCFKLHPFDLTHYKEWRPGYRWLLDCITWSQTNSKKEKYSFVMRDVSTGYFKVFNVVYRTDFLQLFTSWVEEIRTSSHMQGHMHTIVGELHCDFDGVFREDSKKFTKATKSLGIAVTCVPVEHHEGGVERAMGIMEETVKGLLMERNLPPEWWGDCVQAAEFLLNRFALTRDTKSSDGDAIRPIEKLTAGSYSRRRIDRELSYYIGPGTLALVHDVRVKGSDVSAKVRFGVACGMISDVVLFKCPYTHAKYRSKSYTVVQLPSTISYSQFLNLPTPKNKNCMPNLKNLTINVKEKQSLSTLPEPRAWKEDRLRDIKFLERINYADEECLEEDEGDNKSRKYDMFIGEGLGAGGGGCMNLTKLLPNNPTHTHNKTQQNDQGTKNQQKLSCETKRGHSHKAIMKETGNFMSEEE